jgi:hypothetical protein
VEVSRSQRRRQQFLDQAVTDRVRPREWLVWGDDGGGADVFAAFWRRAAGARDVDLIGLIHEVDPQWSPPDDESPGADRADGGPWITIVRGASEHDMVEEVADRFGAEVRGFLCLTLVAGGSGQARRLSPARPVDDRWVRWARRRDERRRDRAGDRRRWRAAARPWAGARSEVPSPPPGPSAARTGPKSPVRRPALAVGSPAVLGAFPGDALPTDDEGGDP